MSFFNKADFRNTKIGKHTTCASCGLYRHVLSPRMEPYGDFGKGILNVGEAPGETEDEKGRQWQGKVGRILQRTYRRLGISIFEDCLNFNAVNCRPTSARGGNRPPTNNEINCCRRRVMGVIEQYQPHVIVLFGGAAVQSVIGSRWKKNLGGITKWRGWAIPDRDLNAWIVPTFHPSFIARQKDDAAQTIWMKDLELAIRLAEEPLPRIPDPKRAVHILQKPREIAQALDELQSRPAVAVDWETTGRKLHDQTIHRIVSVGLFGARNRAYSFLMPKSPRLQAQLKTLLTSGPHKIAHNMKYEEMAAQTCLGYGIQPWGLCTMLNTHVLDNRPGICSLKFQTYVRFGIPDYDSTIEGWLKAKDNKNGNSPNRVMDLLKSPEKTRELLLYNGQDALFTYWLAQEQTK